MDLRLSARHDPCRFRRGEFEQSPGVSRRGKDGACLGCAVARRCNGDLKLCAGRFADWADCVREAAQREFRSRDPQTQAPIADLTEKVIRLGRTMRSQ